jgi:hypothetical protein
MTARASTVLQAWFEDMDRPTGTQFSDLIDSIPIYEASPGKGITVGTGSAEDLWIHFDLDSDQNIMWDESEDEFNFSAGIKVQGALKVTGASILSGAVDIQNTLAVSGVARFSSIVSMEQGLSVLNAAIDSETGYKLNTTEIITSGRILQNVKMNTVSKTANYTATATDHVILCDASGGAFTITLPAASGAAGVIYHIKKTDSSGNLVTIDANASEAIDGDLTPDLTVQYESLMIACDGSNWHVI